MNETLTTAFRSASSGALLQSRKVTPGHRQSSSCGGREGGRLLPRGLVGSSPPGGPRAAGRYQLTGTDACTALRSPPPWPVGSPRRGFASPTGPGRLTWAQLPGAPPALRPLSITHAQTAVTHAQPAAAGPPHATMECLEGSAVGPCAGSVYLRPLRLHYRQPWSRTSLPVPGLATLFMPAHGLQLLPAGPSEEPPSCFHSTSPGTPGSPGSGAPVCPCTNPSLTITSRLSVERPLCLPPLPWCSYCLLRRMGHRGQCEPRRIGTEGRAGLEEWTGPAGGQRGDAGCCHFLYCWAWARARKPVAWDG
ncbi:uridine diphosphate glucose pyrophosphatase isoform X3 [Heterocephalus glaber]|uniref:Uridine diphosphate glucose pyrophosphatase isoform X3 n=1 Tax=Heterocephalus glaber TaxID=10181 RepID=A0AAX6QNA2_HETGA|nr:uridine diphosphate glucose pyrophosphatase isoform X3 [Heterocephalus glaber]XP_012921615.1 uridine diphosphate glucose pyrophosphatase isoform X3 [Heterocephalus glaber]